jgi:protein-S-isoprenylcysteine O-methyltransferase Ste14
MTVSSGPLAIRIARIVARWRVATGFILGAVVLWLAQPTSASLARGAVFAVIGETLRLWAAGHLEKSREVTRSGPYRFTRHPLYLGSTIIAVGIAVASASVAVAAIVAVYVLTAIRSAIVAEEAHLREKFGGEYDAYKARAAPPMTRAFSLARARFNREHQTIGGVLLGFALLATRAWLR